MSAISVDFSVVHFVLYFSPHFVVVFLVIGYARHYRFLLPWLSPQRRVRYQGLGTLCSLYLAAAEYLLVKKKKMSLLV